MRVNPETQFVEPANGKLTADGFNAIREALTGSSSGGGGGSTTLIDCWAGMITEPVIQDYMLVLNVPFDGTIVETTTQSVVGTANFAFKINGSALGGTANDVSPLEQSQSHSADNAFVAGDNIVVSVSIPSGCEEASFTIRYTRQI